MRQSSVRVTPRPMDCHGLRPRNDVGDVMCLVWRCSIPRHCEERSDTAIQRAGNAEAHGLPRPSASQ